MTKLFEPPVVPADRYEEWQARFVMHLFRITHSEFLVKAEGNVDSLGCQWQPLHLKTRVYRPLSDQEQASVGYARQHRGLLTEGQDRVWRMIYSQWLRHLVSANSRPNGTPTAADKKQAAQRAWAAVKALGAWTKISKLAGRQVQILVRSGALLHSLSPGTVVGSTYEKPFFGYSTQIARIDVSHITIGTSVPYASQQAARRPIWPPGVIQWIYDAAHEAAREVGGY